MSRNFPFWKPVELTFLVPLVGGGAYVYTGVWKWWFGGVLMSAGYIICGIASFIFPKTDLNSTQCYTTSNKSVRLRDHDRSELQREKAANELELSAFLIATQLKKMILKRYPVSFLIAGLGSLGAGYYGNKYYRAVMKGEHIRRFSVNDNVKS